jgi:hypothetical protein
VIDGDVLSYNTGTSESIAEEQLIKSFSGQMCTVANTISPRSLLQVILELFVFWKYLIKKAY